MSHSLWTRRWRREKQRGTSPDQRWIYRIGRNLCLIPVLALLACDYSSTQHPSFSLADAQAADQRKDSQPFSVLTVAFCADPVSWFTTGSGAAAGFEHDLLQKFSQEVRLNLRPVAVPDAGELRRKLKNAGASVSAGLYRPDGSDQDGILWTDSYYSADTVLVYNTEVRRPKNWADITGDTVVYIEDSGMETVIAKLREEHPEIRWKPIAAPSSDSLLSWVNDGIHVFALVSSHEAALSRNIYMNFATAFSTGAKIEMALALPADKSYLRDVLNAFIARAKDNGLIDRLAERYFVHPEQVARLDAGAFQERLRSDLPQLRPLFHRAQESSGVEWRLLAAVAYQESQWDPFAESETGVRGFMQITRDTARYLGVKDRLDPEESVMAAAGYLQELKDRLPAEVAEPDRTWLALAAYNIGIGHLEDARVLARERGLNPLVWKDIKQTLPLLARPEYYRNARYGYARGGMPVAYVDRVRAYYDILLRREPDHPHLLLRADHKASDSDRLSMLKEEPLLQPPPPGKKLLERPASVKRADSSPDGVVDLPLAGPRRLQVSETRDASRSSPEKS